jgi:hypothetical protein
VVTHNENRGQVLLIGAVTIGVLLVGIALLVNAVVFTESAAVTGTRVGVDDAREVEATVERDTTGLMTASARSEGYVRKDEFESDLERYQSHLNNATVEERPAVVEIRVNDSRTTTAGLFVQDPSASPPNLVNDDGDEEWTFADDVTRVPVFEVNLTRVPVGPTERFVVRIENASGAYWELSAYRSPPASNEVHVETRSSSSPGWTEICTRPGPLSSSGDLRWTLDGGLIDLDPCDRSTPFATGVAPPYSLSFDQSTVTGQKAQGSYRIATDGNARPSNFDDPGDPNIVPTLYDVSLDVTYRSPSVTYRTDVNASVVDESAADPDEVVFVDTGGGLRTLDADGTVTNYFTGGTVEAVGPKRIDFDGDGRTEVPFVDAAGELYLIDETNQSTGPLATRPPTDHSRLAVGRWRGEASVFYGNGSDPAGPRLWRVTPGSAPEPVFAGGNRIEASAVSGVLDYDRNGVLDLLYTDGGEELSYVDGETDTTNHTGDDVGSGPGVGVGAPEAFGAQEEKVPVVTPSGALVLYAPDSGNSTLLVADAEPYSPARTALVGADWNGDGVRDVVYVRADNDRLHYVTPNGTAAPVTYPDGSSVTVDPEVGVA